MTILGRLGLARIYVGRACPSQEPILDAIDPRRRLDVPCPHGDDRSWEHYHPRWWDWRIVRAR